MKKTINLLLLLVFTAVLSAEAKGEYGFKMLTIDTGAAIAALGGTGAFSTQDAFAPLSNPSASLLNQGKTISVTQNYWIFDTSLTSIGYVSSTGNKAMGIYLRQLDYGKFQERDDSGELIGEFHPIDLVMTLNVSYRIKPDHYLGADVSALYEKIDNASSLGGAISIGYVYFTPLRGIKVAAALKHLGYTSTMNEENIKLPVNGELSLIKDWEFEICNIAAEIKAMQNIDDEQVKAVIGLNSVLYDRLSLRLAYRLNYDAEDFSAGLGFRFRNFQLDYAYIPFDFEIEDVHIIGLSYHF
ncbi:MAG: PorV/PorQ family protein [Candidatus Cloacimonetes bacterium]|nr:PorV/PorQ family protein [Candidatus Cloacimonadota bacterium]